MWRREAIKRWMGSSGGEQPVVCECHAGSDDFGVSLYREFDGVAFDRDWRKTGMLVKRSPSWAVYEGKSDVLARIGAGRHLRITLLDINPYGAPWSLLRAWFDSPREHPNQMILVAYDGLRAMKMGKAWDNDELQDAVMRFGADQLQENYGIISEALVEEITGQVGYELAWWRYSDGGRNRAAHWIAHITR